MVIGVVVNFIFSPVPAEVVASVHDAPAATDSVMAIARRVFDASHHGVARAADLCHVENADAVVVLDLVGWCVDW